MASILEDKDRKIIPRWRQSGVTAALGELAHGRPDRIEIRGARYLIEEKIQDWLANRSVSFAADLLGAAIVLDRFDEASEAARFVLNEDSGSTPATRVLALRILRAPANPADPTVPPKDRIRQLRTRLRDEPRNSVLWVDLARLHATLGNVRQAARAIHIAVGVSPNNRFVVRSAARLYIHCGDPESAHDLLLRAESVQHDPWLLAAEIAVGSILNRPSEFIKDARNMLSAGAFSPFHLSELASAVGTLELSHGNVRRGSKLFQQALTDPTENCVAQARWAGRLVHEISIEPRHLLVPRTYEAKAWKYYYAGDWEPALSEFRGWHEDQPFSAAPAIQGSYLAAVALQDYDEAIRFAQAGLVANPQDGSLWNNLAFSCAQSWKLKEAEDALARVPSSGLGASTEVAKTATAGLIQFRRGNPEVGRALYRNAIEQANVMSQGRLRALALLHLAFEELLASTPEASQAKALALEACRVIQDPDIRLLVRRLQEIRVVHQP